MMAAFFQSPDLVLDKDESAALAKAIADVSEHYGLAAALDDKTVAWINLAQTSVAIYGTRFMNMRLKARMAAQDRADKASQPKQEPIAPGPSAPRREAPAETASASNPGLPRVELELPKFIPN